MSTQCNTQNQNAALAAAAAAEEPSENASGKARLNAAVEPLLAAFAAAETQCGGNLEEEILASVDLSSFVTEHPESRSCGTVGVLF